MNSLIIPMVLFGILIIFGVVFFAVTSSQSKKNSIENPNEKKNQKKDGNKKGKTIESIPKEDVFKFMEFDRILDNMIVQDNGTKFTMIVKCKGINYDLMSEVERLAVEEGFITFLNTLRFPIQLYVQAQNIDLKKNVRLYNERIMNLQEEYEAASEKYNEVLDHLDSTSEEIRQSELNKRSIQNVYEYATDIIKYVEKLSLNKSLLQRNFYIIFSYHTSEITSGEKFTKEEIIDICFNELYTRAQGIIGSLAACSVNSGLLDSNELAELLYTSYDRDDSNIINIRQALDSGYYRLYSTSHDAFQKREELLDKKIAEEAEIRAYEALKKAIQEGKFVPDEVADNELDEEISKKAIDVVKTQRVSEDLKENAKNIIIDEYKENKTQRINKLKEKLEGTTSNENDKKSELNQDGLSKQINRLEHNDINEDIVNDKKRMVEEKKAAEETISIPPISGNTNLNMNAATNQPNEAISNVESVQGKSKTEEPIVSESSVQENKEIKKEVAEPVKQEPKRVITPKIEEEEKKIPSAFEESGLRSASRHFELDDKLEEQLKQDVDTNPSKKEDNSTSEDDEDELII